jgi:hypothetical protein
MSLATRQIEFTRSETIACAVSEMCLDDYVEQHWHAIEHIRLLEKSAGVVETHA